MGAKARDCWAEWLANRRFGGDPELARKVLADLSRVRGRVLANAAVAAGDTVLDVGCGDGLIAFGALDVVGDEGRVVFSDISDDLLAECRRRAADLEASDRCRFVRASADDLGPIADASIDVVTTRSVLIYVKNKELALREFWRVLKPGGRISLFEPINRFGARERVEETFWGYDVGDLVAVRDKLNALYEELQPPDDPMLDFEERDLLALAERTGFFPVELQYEAKVEPIEPRRWETFLYASGNPKIPTLDEAMEQALAPEERQRVVAHLRPLVEEGRGVWRMATVYVKGVKAKTN